MSFKVYTKTGDKGTTGLIGGARVGKDHIRIEAYGTVDELNSYIGVVSDSIGLPEQSAWLKEIQDRLFTMGAVLATDPNKVVKMELPDLLESDVTLLEKWIDQMDGHLPAMKTFVLPGGHIASSHAHVARCICRRAERICVHMHNENDVIPDLVLKYLNRLSDFLFVLSRFILHAYGKDELPWKPRVHPQAD